MSVHKVSLEESLCYLLLLQPLVFTATSPSCLTRTALFSSGGVPAEILVHLSVSLLTGTVTLGHINLFF